MLCPSTLHTRETSPSTTPLWVRDTQEMTCKGLFKKFRGCFVVKSGLDLVRSRRSSRDLLASWNSFVWQEVERANGSVTDVCVSAAATPPGPSLPFFLSQQRRCCRLCREANSSRHGSAAPSFPSPHICNQGAAPPYPAPTPSLHHRPRLTARRKQAQLTACSS